MILIDGDMILHNDFIEDHAKNAFPGYFVQGTRVLLTKDRTQAFFKTQKLIPYFFNIGLRNRKNAIHSNILSLIFSVKKNYLRGIKTCNVAFFREDCISVNGFNNDFEGWGKEDSEFFCEVNE